MSVQRTAYVTAGDNCSEVFGDNITKSILAYSGDVMQVDIDISLKTV
jgi:hypothetical protein